MVSLDSGMFTPEAYIEELRRCLEAVVTATSACDTLLTWLPSDESQHEETLKNVYLHLSLIKRQLEQIKGQWHEENK